MRHEAPEHWTPEHRTPAPTCTPPARERRLSRLLSLATTGAVAALTVALPLGLTAPAQAQGPLRAPTPAPSASPPASPSTPDAKDDGTRAWSVRPATDGKPDSRTNFKLQGNPGDVVKEQVLISNVSKVKETFKIYATDAYNAVDGGFDLLKSEQKPVDIGTWVTFPAPQVTIEAGASVVVPLTIAIPKNASPGDHAGGVVVSLAAGTTVAREYRVSVRLYMRLPGYLRPVLAVQSLNATYHGLTNPFGKGTVELTYTVVNTGNIRLQSHPKIRVSAYGITNGHLTPPDLPELLPGQRVTYTAKVTGVFPAGLIGVSVQLTPFADPVQPVGQAIPTAEASTDLFAVNWLLVLLLLIFLASVFFLVRHLRMRRKQAAERLALAVKRAKRQARKEALAEAGAAKAGAANADTTNTDTTNTDTTDTDTAKAGAAKGATPSGETSDTADGATR